jgi:hypothetical protein
MEVAMNWLQLIYEYTAGGIFFFITLYIALRSGGSDLKNPSDRMAVMYLIGGLVVYFIAITLWILLAPLG